MSKNKKKSSFIGKLCNDELFEIFGFCVVKDLLTTQRVCKTWKYVISSKSEIYFRNLYLKHWKNANFTAKDLSLIETENIIPTKYKTWKSLFKTRYISKTNENEISKFFNTKLSIIVKFDQELIDDASNDREKKIPLTEKNHWFSKTPGVFDDNDDSGIRTITPPELQYIAFNGPEITFWGGKKYRSKVGFFTVEKLLEVVEEYDRYQRGEVEAEDDWLDIGHVFFEGISKSSNGQYSVGWGS